MQQHTCGSQWTTCKIWFSPLTGNGLRSSRVWGRLSKGTELAAAQSTRKDLSGPSLVPEARKVPGELVVPIPRGKLGNPSLSGEESEAAAAGQISTVLGGMESQASSRRD